MLGKPSNLIVWDKGGGGIGDLSKTFSTDHEMALVFHRGSKITGKRLGSVWSIGKDASSKYLHPTQKPVGLAEMAIVNVTNEKQIVLDFFLGSGSTLIACEKNKRILFGLELSEAYCDVIINRWQNYTGKKATLESTKQTYEELKSERA
jgi:DNA modification methylase